MISWVAHRKISNGKTSFFEVVFLQVSLSIFRVPGVGDV